MEEKKKYEKALEAGTDKQSELAASSSQDVLFLQALQDPTAATCQTFPRRMDAFQLQG